MSNDAEPLFSLIIPTFNSEAVISEALHSVSTQTFENFEVLLIDNISRDATQDIFTQHYKKDGRFRFYSESDRGIYDAMNKGIALARGMWVYFMGADDKLFSSEVLETVSKQVQSTDEIVYGDVNWLPGNIPETGAWTLEMLLNRNINHQRIFYRRELFQRNADYKIQYRVAADYELNIRMFSDNKIRKRYIPVTVSNYFAGGFSFKRFDEIFWNNWESTVYGPLKSHLNKRTIYFSLGRYCRYNIEHGSYRAAFLIASKVFLNTWSFGFLRLMVMHFFHTRREHAR